MLAHRHELLLQARRLAYFTVAWNLGEGVVAMVGAATAGSRALLGFGLDSFVESLSAGVVIWRLRVERIDPSRADHVERRALRLIGLTFFALAAFVAVESLRSLTSGTEPESSPIGIGITALSLIVMPILARRKRQVGAAMRSRAVEADSMQTSACVYLSVAVLIGLLLNASFGWWWADPVAALVVAGLLTREGWAALRAESVDDCC